MSTFDRWSLLFHMILRHQNGLSCGHLIALIIAASGCMIADVRPEMPDKGIPKIILQQAMPALTIPPAAHEHQMFNFPNIGHSIFKTHPNLMASDLVKANMAVSASPDFDQLIGFRAELLLPDIKNLHFFYPDQTRLKALSQTKFEEYFSSSIGLHSQQTIIPIVEFSKPLTTSLNRPLAMQMLCYCFETESPSNFAGKGIINVDFTGQTAFVREIDLRDDDMHSLRGSMAFQISNSANSFLDESAIMTLRLNKQRENSWDTRVIGAFHAPNAPHVSAQFIAMSGEDEAMMIGQFTSK
jgi:hypothetical protein